MTEGKNELVKAAKYERELILTPRETIADGKEQAKALMEVCRPVKIQGKDYLRFEDWQTLARFNGLSVGADDSQPVEVNGVHGFKAHAVVRNALGHVIGEAVGYCLREGARWGRSGVEDYAVASMAQTRACAKALRNCCGWVAVLAGVSTTPAEEMPDEEHEAPSHAAAAPTSSDKVTEILTKIEQGYGLFVEVKGEEEAKKALWEASKFEGKEGDIGFKDMDDVKKYAKGRKPADKKEKWLGSTLGKLRDAYQALDK